jgi:hypothetical protein
MPRLELKDQFSSLRTEIIESQKARIDLLKYKLLAIATLGAVGLGIGNYHSDTHEFIYIICIIPFVCIYVDLLCFHNNLRILVIGRFLHNCGDTYEKFISALNDYAERCCHKKPRYFFKLEDGVLQWSSVALSGIIAFFGLYSLIYKPADEYQGPIFLIVGFVGIILPIIIWKIFNKRVKVLFDFADADLGDRSCI